jgi:hypothetical protein
MGVGGASEVEGGVYHELHFPTPLVHGYLDHSFANGPEINRTGQ